MAYTWCGMKKMSWRDVLELHDREELVGCFLLYPDGTEAEIEDGYDFEEIIRHHQSGGEFGYEL